MKINKIEIKNFKLFEKEFDTIDQVSDKDLLVFNGPNGYGKTSVFDAIELAMTGEIRRIKDYNENLGIGKSEAYKQKILISDSTKDAYIKITLIKENNEISLKRTYMPTNAIPSLKTKDNNPVNIFNDFSLSIEINGEVLPREKNEDFLREINLSNITDFYDKCCYISQDENLQFLKEGKKNKASSLDFLFGVPNKIECKLNRVGECLEKIKNNNTKNNIGILKKIENNRNDLREKIRTLEKDVLYSQELENTKNEYINLFSNPSIKWDLEKLELDEMDYEDAMKCIERLIYYSKEMEHCINYINNKKYQGLITPFNGSDNIEYINNKVEYLYRYFPVLNKGEEIKREYDFLINAKKLNATLAKREIKNINWSFIIEEDLFDGEIVDIIREKIDGINKMEKLQSATASSLDSVMQARISLLKYSQEAIKYNHIKDNICPLCGMEYFDYSEFENAINLQTNKLKEISDDTSRKIGEEIDCLYNAYFNKLIESLNVKIDNNNTEKLYLIYTKVCKYTKEMYEMHQFLKEMDLVVPEDYTDDVEHIRDAYENAYNKITSCIKPIPKEIEEKLVVLGFEDDYRIYFECNETKLKNITEQLLVHKRNYIIKKFSDKRVLTLKKYNDELEKLEERINKLNKVIEKINLYKMAIDDGIKSYKKKILSDIEPLLYVYTAKILQQKFNGKSIYIDTDKNLKSMQFVNSPKDNQDVLYNMSSGQLATVSLAFMLCMNQVYAEKNSLPILLIDDPVQTIDDVNMVGLVDILRYEFEDRQIFISTHEQKFEWYLIYKFKKADKKVDSYNMKKIMLE